MKIFIVWQKKWETGIKKIDEQHKHFVELLNKTYYINETDKKKSDIEKILNDLLEYARVHFSTEEGYFDETDYPGSDEHKEKHKELLADAIRFYNLFEEKKEFSNLVEELLIFLKNWLDEHLIEMDKIYVPWLTQHGIK